MIGAKVTECCSRTRIWGQPCDALRTYMLESLWRLQVLGLAPVPLGEAGHDLKRIAACLGDDPVGVASTLAVGPDLEHLADGGDEGVLEALHDLLPRSELDGAPLLH